jgi:hypothetical protein
VPNFTVFLLAVVEKPVPLIVAFEPGVLILLVIEVIVTPGPAFTLTVAVVLSAYPLEFVTLTQ